MNEDEDITTYFLRVDELVNSIKGLRDEIKESIVVKKLLRSLSMRFDSNISTLEERVDLTTMTIYELHGTLTTYEMRTDQDNLVTMEAAFKESNKTNQKNKQKEKSDSSSSDVSEDDEEVDNFVRTLKREPKNIKVSSR